MVFAVPVDHRVKIKESENWDKYSDLAREQTKLWNMGVTVIPIIIETIRMVPKGLERWMDELEMGGITGTIQTTAFSRSARILRRVLEAWGDLPSLRLQVETIT